MPGCPSQPVVSDILAAALFTLALYWAIGATVYRMVTWARTASPLPIPLTPAPRTRVGVAGRLFLEVFTFRSLARANTTTWIASLLFHYGLLLVMIMHLRFVFPQLPLILLPFIQFSGWALMAMMSGLSVLLLRRVLVDRVRYISSPSDYLHLVLLMLIGLSGAALKRLWPANLFDVGLFLRGAITVQWQSLPEGAVVVLHIALATVLLLIFPISKLVHGVGILFSPTLNQRER